MEWSASSPNGSADPSVCAQPLLRANHLAVLCQHELLGDIQATVGRSSGPGQRSLSSEGLGDVL